MTLRGGGAPGRRPPRGVRPALVVLLALAGVTAAGAQQPALASGRVVRIRDADTLGVAGARVILHRVGREVQGPIDSLIAGPRGEFRFRFAADTAAVYLLSSGYAGIEYFSTPVHTDPVRPDTGLLLIVSDTSASAPVRVDSRHIVIGKPAADGTRAALEIVVLQNAGTRTRVPRGDAAPTWGTRIPKGALGFQVGQGDVSAEAVQLRNDSVLLFAPIAPGEKQLAYTYTLPAAPGKVRLPMGDSVAVLTVLLEEFDRTASGGGLEKGDSQRIERRTFQQWNGPVGPGDVVTIDFPAGRINWTLPALVGIVAAGLGVALYLVLRRRPAPAREPLAAGPLDALARLDARYAGREAEFGPEEWARYQRERARLKAEARSQLAGKQSSS